MEDRERRELLGPPYVPYGTGVRLALGGVLGAVAGWIIGLPWDGGPPDTFLGPNIASGVLAILGFWVGCLTAALIMWIVRLSSSARTSPDTWRQRLADWFYLR